MRRVSMRALDYVPDAEHELRFFFFHSAESHLAFSSSRSRYFSAAFFFVYFVG
jgi:hypothetical protein